MTAPIAIQTIIEPSTSTHGTKARHAAETPTDAETARDFQDVLEGPPNAAKNDDRTAQAPLNPRNESFGSVRRVPDSDQLPELGHSKESPTADEAPLIEASMPDEAATAPRKIVIPDLPKSQRETTVDGTFKETAKLDHRSSSIALVETVDTVETDVSKAQEVDNKASLAAPLVKAPETTARKATLDVPAPRSGDMNADVAPKVMLGGKAPAINQDGTKAAAVELEQNATSLRTELRTTAERDIPRTTVTQPVDQAAKANLEIQAFYKRVDEIPRVRTRQTERLATETVPPPTPTTTPNTTTQQPQSTPVQPIIQAMVAKDMSQKSLHADGDLDSLQFDLRSSTSGTSTQATPTALTLSRADLPRAIAMQISEFARAMPDKPVDVSLNPEELGRVRLSVSTGEAGVTLNILAERPETLELMRRHAEQLARELADLGFTSIDLAFGQGNSAEQGDADSDGKSASTGSGRGLDLEVDGIENTPEIRPTAIASSGGMDIRI